jgi:hypothetical protein
MRSRASPCTARGTGTGPWPSRCPRPGRTLSSRCWTAGPAPCTCMARAQQRMSQRLAQGTHNHGASACKRTAQVCRPRARWQFADHPAKGALPWLSAKCILARPRCLGACLQGVANQVGPRCRARQSTNLTAQVGYVGVTADIGTCVARHLEMSCHHKSHEG